MNDTIDDLELEQEAEDMGSDWHSYLQLNIGAYFRYEHRNKYIAFSELSLELTNPYIQPNGTESFVVKPDISIYSIEDKPKRNIDNLKVSKMPICAIEILSPRQALSDLAEKAKCYFQNEIKSCWIVIPEFESIYVFNQSINEHECYSIRDKLIDGVLQIELSVAEIFD